MKSPALTSVALVAGLLAALVITLPRAIAVWRTGIFVDPDDAMRAVELRDFLAGQGWFDLVPHRLSPNTPFTMHWSRLADLPLAVLVRAFSLCGLAPAAAERLMRLVAPAGYLGLSLWATIRVSSRLIGPAARLPAALLIATSFEFLANFMPGHIHHHGLQAMLLVVATMLLIDSVGEGAEARCAAWSAVSLVVSLGVGLQNLPFAIGLAAALALIWVQRGTTASGALRAFGCGLSLAAAPIFLIDVPPQSYGARVCDAFSAAHLVGCLAGGLAFVALSRLTGVLHSPIRRLVAAGTAGLCILALLAAFDPACLGDPMAGVDPLLRRAWLADVGEAMPLFRLVREAPALGLPLFLTLLCGFGATGAAWLATPPHRDRWSILLILGFAGCAGTLWQVRVAASTGAAFIPGVTWAAIRVFRIAGRQPRRPALLFAVVAALLGNGLAWSAAGARLGPLLASTPGRSPDPTQCFEPSAYAALAALPPGLVLSTIDPGSAILAYTAHTVAAAPYHRNTAGNRLSLLALAATPDDAKPMIRAAGVRYVAICRASNETAETILRHPSSLSAALMDGTPPEWLRRIGSPSDPVALFEVVPPVPDAALPFALRPAL